MKILVIGGCHCYGYGVKAGQGFIQKLVAQYKREGNFVQVDYYTPYKMEKIVGLIRHLNLRLFKYDLILLQIGHIELLNIEKFKKLIHFKQRDFNCRVYGEFNESIKHSLNPINISDFIGQGFFGLPGFLFQQSFMDSISDLGKKAVDISQMICMNFHNKFQEIQRLKFVRDYLIEILNALSIHQHKVMLLTPFPVKERVTNFLREEGRAIFMEESMVRGIQCVDTYSIIAKNITNLLSSDDCHLNEAGHEIIYREIQNTLTLKNKNFNNTLKINNLQEYLVFNQN